MKQKLLILLVFVLMTAVLAGLNAASYSQRPNEAETEMFPNRSSYNYGPTGTHALFTLLAETGRQPVRWQQATDALELKRADRPSTFVMIGPLRKDINDPEISPLMKWVSSGGRLVVIDRDPPGAILTADGVWNINTVPTQLAGLLDADPADQNSMTHDIAAAKPSLPSLFTSGVNAVQPSRFASAIDVEKKSEHKGTVVRGHDNEDSGGDVGAQAAPVVHLLAGGKGLLADIRYGSGRVVVLSDPYIVSNGGIQLSDNAQLAINILSNGGPVAFDEYHQGYGANQNRLAEFFAGTPVIAIFFQCVLMVGLIFYSKSRRFGRAVPEAAVDRLSKLEYIGAMAELQQRTRAYDLAIENIYRDLRRRASRLLGVDNTSVPRQRFARMIAEKAGSDPNAVDQLMFKCEEIIAGEPVHQKDAIAIASEIRRLEVAMGLRRRTSR